LVNKRKYNKDKPERGDVAVFDLPGDSSKTKNIRDHDERVELPERYHTGPSRRVLILFWGLFEFKPCCMKRFLLNVPI
jgi:hypothetical protein